MRRPHALAGFGMLEVLVALALVTSVGVAIVLWVESGLHSIGRLRNEYERIEASRTVEDWMRAIPFDATDAGEKELNGMLVKWKRRSLAPTVPQTGYPGGWGAHDISLLEYRFEVYRSKSSETLWFDGSVSVVAAQYVRNFKPPFAGM